MALAGWDRSAEALVTLDGCRCTISQTGSSSCTCGFHGCATPIGVETMVISSMLESKLRSEVEAGLEA